MQSGCDDTLEYRYAIKFCFKIGKNATESHAKSTSHGNNARPYDHIYIESAFLSYVWHELVAY